MIRINITLGNLTFFSFSIASFRFNFTSFIDGFCVSKSSTRLGRSTPPSSTLVYRKQESIGSNNLNHHTNSQRFFLKFSISLSFIASTFFFLSSASWFDCSISFLIFKFFSRYSFLFTYKNCII